ncbi:ubiquinol oxidase subunit II [Aurantimonas sp. MSK8Z-1]|uniref:ubiquinol oxidase subunit II n=1 Tax=Mangrovibrevibacter kandeliae TaxID=2968473 RepID=UPI00211865B0|nr:ubiquinol oxidase subunit II [Aurantimonas sp. MSK8Z-1]MCW4114123.1 ubiquinol oxidase subunit II [Aurantimonas sp. MSK8Z-1]
MKRLRLALTAILLAPLTGCNMVVLNPSGDVAMQQRDLVLISTGLMLLVILPVMALTVLFAWRYRQSNTQATYDPDWDHSTKLELVIWAVPLLIIIALGAFTWMGTHLLDPYRPIGRVASGKPVAADHSPLEVDVVALDWKWLFILPEYGIATVNELAAPVDRPLRFRITSSSVMNSFYIPALAGQIYAMPGMETKLHAVINEPGDFVGFSAQYSGHGFSKMRFRFHGLGQAGFDQWVNEVKQADGMLDRATYLKLEQPSEGDPVRHFSGVDPELFDAVVNMCPEPGKMCMGEMMAIDAKGGLGLEGIRNTLPLTYDKYARRGSVLGPEPRMVAGICSRAEAIASADRKDPPLRDASTPLIGHGLPRPFADPPSTAMTLSSATPLDLDAL